MKKLINIFIFVFAVSWGFVSCDDPFADEDFAAYDEEPMGIYLETKKEYSSWVELLKKADLYNALNVNNDFTCFVGNNEAVARYLKANDFTSIDELTEEQAKIITSYHIIPHIVLSHEALSGQIRSRTASGNYLLVEASAVDPSAPKFLNGSEIINFNQDNMTNGVIHEVKDILSPPIYSVGELLELSDRYSIFNEAAKMSGLDLYLNRTEVDVDAYTTVKDYKTVFAVNDSVFNVYGISSIQDLQNKYDGDPLNKNRAFYRFMAYHILPESYDYNTLVDKEGRGGGRNFLTYLNNAFITVTDEGGIDNFINAHDKVDLAVMFDTLKMNFIANNGYVHEIDKLMNVVDPVGYNFEHEFTNDKEFQVLDIYRGPDTRETVEFKDDSTEFIRWKTIPSGVGFIKYVNMGDIWNMPMSLNDWVIAELGQMGSIEFTIPPIIPGLYKMSVYRWQFQVAVDYATDRGDPGICQTYFNNIKIGGPMDHGDAGAFKFEVGTVRITEMKENKITFKLIQAGALGFDRVLFEPIN